MATLKERLSSEIKDAMKSGAKERLSYARNLHAAIRKKEIDSRIDLDDEGIQGIVSTLIKQRKDAIEQFQKGGRDDLVQAETAEMEFLLTYLPPQLSDDELRNIVDQAVEKAGATSPKDMGKVMPILMPMVQGRADGKKVSEFVRAKLQG